MKTIQASEFKAKCLKLMDEIAETGETLVITKNGKPLSRLVPYRPRVDSLWARHEGEIELADDLIEPTGEDWNAAS
jgi:prevent-host-death family protein